MAIYAITHTCGHVENHRRHGAYNETERHNMVAVLGRESCSDCYRTYRAPNWRREVAAAITGAAETGLPPLRGTRKQLIWAQQIRGTWAPELFALRDRFGGRDVEEDPAVGTLMKTINYSLAMADAGWWIDTTGGGQATTVTMFLRHVRCLPVITTSEHEQLELLLEEIEQDR